MAKDINRTRMHDTRILMGITLLTGIFCKTMFPDETLAHESMDLMGYILVTVCAVGRIYTTAFIGGIKNAKLITWGPYSVCRNPLYFFSLLGAAGIGLMSTSLLAFGIIFFGFVTIYWKLIDREEQFLQERFGQDFTHYKASVPKLLPDLSKYACPEEIPMQPKFLNRAVADAIWWFVPLPLFEIAEKLQEAHIINPIIQIF